MAGYQTGADNELLSDGTWNYAYDPAGNMISQVGISNGLAWYYTYDNQNHVLTASEYSGGQLQQQETNSYDVFGNLVEQDETSGGNTTVTKFANQVKNTSGVSQVWADLNATNQIQTRRVYLDAVDAVCARIASNGTEGWYLTDHLGSIGAIMNNSGTVLDHITYDPWGTPTDSNPSAGDRYKFTGQEFDSVTGQYDYRARCYDAAIGRFTSQDPTGFGGEDMNLYRYCGNSPTLFTDPTGTFQIEFDSFAPGAYSAGWSLRWRVYFQATYQVQIALVEEVTATIVSPTLNGTPVPGFNSATGYVFLGVAEGTSPGRFSLEPIPVNNAPIEMPTTGPFYVNWGFTPWAPGDNKTPIRYSWEVRGVIKAFGYTQDVQRVLAGWKKVVIDLDGGGEYSDRFGKIQVSFDSRSCPFWDSAPFVENSTLKAAVGIVNGKPATLLWHKP